MYPLPQKVNIEAKAHFNYVPELHIEITVKELEPYIIHHTANDMRGIGNAIFEIFTDNESRYVSPKNNYS